MHHYFKNKYPTIIILHTWNYSGSYNEKTKFITLLGLWRGHSLLLNCSYYELDLI